MRNLRKLYLAITMFLLLIPINLQAHEQRGHHRSHGYLSITGNGWYFNYGTGPVYQNYYQQPWGNQTGESFLIIQQQPPTQNISISCPINTRLIIVTNSLSGQQSYRCLRI